MLPAGLYPLLYPPIGIPYTTQGHTSAQCPSHGASAATTSPGSADHRPGKLVDKGYNDEERQDEQHDGKDCEYRLPRTGFKRSSGDQIAELRGYPNRDIARNNHRREFERRCVVDPCGAYKDSRGHDSHEPGKEDLLGSSQAILQRLMCLSHRIWVLLVARHSIRNRSFLHGYALWLSPENSVANTFATRALSPNVALTWANTSPDLGLFCWTLLLFAYVREPAAVYPIRL